jgi:hypothetical protein
MQTCKWFVMVSWAIGGCAVVGGPASAGEESPAAGVERRAVQEASAAAPPRTPTPPPQDKCKLTHGTFPSLEAEISQLISGACPSTVCGLNGVWLGAGVAFRELHLNGGVNAQGLRIIQFLDAKDHPLQINVDHDVLEGKLGSGVVLTGAALKGARIFLGPLGRTATYVLTITDYSTTPSWTECTGCAEPVRPVPVYQFSATSVTDSCEVEVCRPGLAPDYAGGLVGKAVIYRGDYYDETTYSVRDQPAPDRRNLDNDLFNIACSGTSLFKLHLLRHTAASASAGVTTTVDQRQAILRLLAADYCGAGHPFTVDGMPIELGFATSLYDVTLASGYRLSGKDSTDAYWSQSGASCIGVPRLARAMSASDAAAFLDTILAVCPSLPVGCGLAPPSSDYATSANP